MVDAEEDTCGVVKGFFKKIISKYEDTFNLSKGNHPAQYIHFTVYSIILTILLGGSIGECYHIWQSNARYAIFYVGVILAAFFDLMIRSTIRITHKKSVERSGQKNGPLIVDVQVCLGKMTAIIMIAVSRQVMYLNDRNDEIMKLHWTMLAFSYFGAIAYLFELAIIFGIVDKQKDSATT